MDQEQLAGTQHTKYRAVNKEGIVSGHCLERTAGRGHQ
jgi:hypothetical protein